MFDRFRKGNHEENTKVTAQIRCGDRFSDFFNGLQGMDSENPFHSLKKSKLFVPN